MTGENLWRELRVGDHIRFVHMPTEFAGPDYFLHEETRSLYERLIASGELLTVTKVDDDGLPWIDCRNLADDGQPEFHTLAVNHSGLEKVLSA